MPIIIAATNDIENSVMIAGINEFQNRYRRGAIMKMNSDGVDFVSSFICTITVMLTKELLTNCTCVRSL